MVDKLNFYRVVSVAKNLEDGFLDVVDVVKLQLTRSDEVWIFALVGVRALVLATIPRAKTRWSAQTLFCPRRRLE